MKEPQTRKRTYLVRILVVAGLLALFEIFVGFFGAGMTGLRLAALIAFGVIVLGNEAYRRVARQ